MYSSAKQVSTEMPKISNFEDVHGILKHHVGVTVHKSPYKLERMRALMAYLGNPQDDLKVIHVAGTSGKTSTSYYVAALLQHAGYRVGLTVSPHVDEVNERVQIGLEPLHEKLFCQNFETFMELVTKSGLRPSYFEVLVAFAYWYFAKTAVDYAVIEVGLGGLMDATNVVTRADKVCVITDIGYDHIHILGDTLPLIAIQKAGIIQASNTVFMHHQDAAVEGEVRSAAEAKNATLYIQGPPSVNNPGSVSLPLFQRRNFDLAVAVVRHVIAQAGEELGEAAIADAAGTYIPARMETVNYAGKLLILDGSHIEQKQRALVDSVLERYPGRSIGLLAAFGTNKIETVRDSLRQLRRLSDDIILTQFTSIQDEIRGAIPVSELENCSLEAGFSEIKSVVDPQQAFRTLIKSDHDLLIVTGSFYLLNDIRPLVFDTSPTASTR
jgi:dihydrofolate synthase / folylpolyglutamate synthase